MMVFLRHNKIKNIAIFFKHSTNFGRGWYQNIICSVGGHPWGPYSLLFSVRKGFGLHKKQNKHGAGCLSAYE